MKLSKATLATTDFGWQVTTQTRVKKRMTLTTMTLIIRPSIGLGNKRLLSKTRICYTRSALLTNISSPHPVGFLAAFMAIVAAFDLEIRQCDAVNAFINSLLNKEIYCRASKGFKREGHC